MFVSVTRIDVVENYLQQETHSGGGDRGIGEGEGKGDESGESGGNSGIREGEGGRGAFPLIEWTRQLLAADHAAVSERDLCCYLCPNIVLKPLQ